MTDHNETIKYQVSKSQRNKKRDEVSQYTLKFSFDLLEGMTAKGEKTLFSALKRR